MCLFFLKHRYTIKLLDGSLKSAHQQMQLPMTGSKKKKDLWDVRRVCMIFVFSRRPFPNVERNSYFGSLRIVWLMLAGQDDAERDCTKDGSVGGGVGRLGGTLLLPLNSNSARLQYIIWTGGYIKFPKGWPAKRERERGRKPENKRQKSRRQNFNTRIRSLPRTSYNNNMWVMKISRDNTAASVLRPPVRPVSLAKWIYERFLSFPLLRPRRLGFHPARIERMDQRQ